MRLTAFTDYGLRALMRHAGAPDGMLTTEQTAAKFAISRNHLTKVVRELTDAGFIATQRGAGGGFRLAHGGDCVLTPQCRLKGRLAAARKAFLAEFEKSSLTDCAYQPSRRKSQRVTAPSARPSNRATAAARARTSTGE